MKKCLHCGLSKSLEDFHVRSASKDGRQAICKECRKKADAERFKENSPRRREFQIKRRKELLEWVASIKESNPCTDCGQFYPYYVMQFDHITDEKDANVGDMVRWGYSRKRIAKEIEICELVCANCHAVRTHQRRNGFTVGPMPD